MGVLYDYFIAPSDAAAAATIDRQGGPADSSSWGNSRRGMFRRRSNSGADAPAPVAYPTLVDTGIDPVVQGGTLEELLTGRLYEEIEQDPRWGKSLAVRNGGEGLVLTLTEGLIEALAESSPEQLTDVAAPWSQTEEFWGAGDPEQLAPLLRDLADLARRARSEGHSLYCWVSV